MVKSYMAQKENVLSVRNVSQREDFKMIYVIYVAKKMKAVDFKGVNVIFAKNQPQYKNLPAMRLPDGQVITCWELEEGDLKIIKKNGGKFYISISTFNNDLQPLMVMADLSEGLDLKL